MADVVDFAFDDVQQTFIVRIEDDVGCADRKAACQVLPVFGAVDDNDRDFGFPFTQPR